jgi:exodeoxyribonuclease VII large subunit
LLPSLRLSTKEAEHELEQLSTRHARAWREAVALARRGLDQAQLRLDLLDPELVLERGYAWLSDELGRPVVDGQTLSAGQHIQATLSGAQLQMSVLAVQNREI